MKRWLDATWVALALILLPVAAGCGGSPSLPDPPLRTLEDFCRLYFEQADPGAALPLTTGEARRLLLEETHLLAGTEPPGTAVSQVTLLERQDDATGNGVKFLVEVRVPPHSSQVRGTTTQVIPFDVFVSRDPTASGAVWRVNAFLRH